MGQFDDAARAFEQARGFDGTNLDASWGLIRAGIYSDSASGDFDPEVVRMRLDLVLERDRDRKDATPYALLGNLVAAGDPDRARGYYNEALEIDPKLVLAHYGLGLLLFARKEYEAAASQFKQVTDFSPWNIDGHDNLAYARLYAGDIKGARVAYERALKMDPDRISLYVGMAETERLDGRWKEARVGLENVVNMLNDSATMAMEKNQVEWRFTSDLGAVSFAKEDLVGKRLLARLLLALDCTLDGDAAGAAAAIAAVREDGATVPQEVRQVLDSQVRRVRNTHPERAADLNAYVRLAAFEH